jgi:large conductance mechanosensitive channel
VFKEFKAFIARGNVLDLAVAVIIGAAFGKIVTSLAGVSVFGYGAFITAAVNFLILAFIIFMLIRAVNRLMPKPDEAPAAEPADIALLREIRDELKKKSV